MWMDNDSPGCLYDTIDCTGNCCEIGRKMYEEYCSNKFTIGANSRMKCDIYNTLHENEKNNLKNMKTEEAETNYVYIEQPDYYIRIGVKDDKVVELDWKDMPKSKINEPYVLRIYLLLKKALELLHSKEKEENK